MAKRKKSASSKLNDRYSGDRSQGRPFTQQGRPGTPIYNGYLVSTERNPDLLGSRKWKTYTDIISNVAIVATGVRYFLNLTAKGDWEFEPPRGMESDDEAKRYADEITRQIHSMTETSWKKVIRRAAMYRFLGFSIQEWSVARRAEDGAIVLGDVQPRPQSTIDRWDVDVTGRVNGVVQEDPQTGREFYLPRTKLLYLVDDTLNDSPAGVGLLRHAVESSNRLKRYLDLEGWGFETDLRGIPIGRGPFAELQRQVQKGLLSKEDAEKAIEELRNFVNGHIRTPDLGLLLDSMTYTARNEAGTPSTVPHWNVELLKGSVSSALEVGKAIERETRVVARLLGIEHLLMGDGDRGSEGMAKDKSANFALIVDATTEEIGHQVVKDIVRRIFMLNGWPQKYVPRAKTEHVQYRDVREMSETIERLARSGATLQPDDPAINSFRELMGMPKVDLEEARRLHDEKTEAERSLQNITKAPGNED